MLIKYGEKYMQISYFDISVILMSFCGIGLFRLGNTQITPFYMLAIFVVIPFSVKHCTNNRFQRCLLIWGLASVSWSTICLTYTKMSSVLHFAFYIFFSFCFIGLMDDNKYHIKRICGFVIVSNCINVLLSFLGTTFNISVPFLSEVFRKSYVGNVVRYSGFSSEPSYLAMILSICMLSLINLNLISFNEKGDIIIILSYFLCVYLAKTSLGIISMFFVIFMFLLMFIKNNKRISNHLIAFLIIFLIVPIVFIVLRNGMNSAFVYRLINIFDLVLKSKSFFDFQIHLRIIDSSAWYRIGPIIRAILDMKLDDIHTWFGHGIGSDALYYTSLLSSGTVIRGGFWQSSLYNQGIIGSVFFVILVFKEIRVLGFWIVLYLCACMANCAASTQVFWFMIIILLWTSKCKKSDILTHE